MPSVEDAFVEWLKTEEGQQHTGGIFPKSDPLELAFRAGWHAGQLDISSQITQAIAVEMDKLVKPT